MHSLKTIVFQIDIILKVSKSQKHFFCLQIFLKKQRFLYKFLSLVFRSTYLKTRFFFEIWWPLVWRKKAIWTIGNVTNSNFFFRWLLVGEIGFTGYELYLGIGKYIFYRTFEYERNHTQPGMNQRERLRGVQNIFYWFRVKPLLKIGSAKRHLLELSWPT